LRKNGKEGRGKDVMILQNPSTLSLQNVQKFCPIYSPPYPTRMLSRIFTSVLSYAIE
jgi:hypothetical protein